MRKHLKKFFWFSLFTKRTVPSWNMYNKTYGSEQGFINPHAYLRRTEKEKFNRLWIIFQRKETSE